MEIGSMPAKKMVGEHRIWCLCQVSFYLCGVVGTDCFEQTAQRTLKDISLGLLSLAIFSVHLFTNYVLMNGGIWAVSYKLTDSNWHLSG
jgi:hypothetical protein